jgi:hypothetical protein
LVLLIFVVIPSFFHFPVFLILLLDSPLFQ